MSRPLIGNSDPVACSHEKGSKGDTEKNSLSTHGVLTSSRPEGSSAPTTSIEPLPDLELRQEARRVNDRLHMCHRM